MRFWSGTVASADRSNFGGEGALLNRFSAQTSMLRFTSIPSGYSPPGTWAMGRISGGLATFTSLSGLISSSASLNRGSNLVGALTGAISLTSGNLGLIVSLIAAISGSGLLTNADLVASAGISAAISATGTITDAQLGALFSMISSITGSGTLSANDFATAAMTADISSLTPLSPQSLADAVWNATLASYPDVGTAGKALSGAGAAGNPWAALLVNNGDPGTFGERVQKLLQLAQYLGLK
jgi:hypothetical protein